MEERSELCLEEEVERLRRTGMSTDEIAKQMGVDRSWVESLVSMWTGEDPSAARQEPEGD